MDRSQVTDPYLPGPGGLHWVDGVIVGLYACAMLALGWYFGKKQQSTDEYFVGSRSMNPVLIGVSMFATLFSTISYLSTPGRVDQPWTRNPDGRGLDPDFLLHRRLFDDPSVHAVSGNQRVRIAGSSPGSQRPHDWRGVGSSCCG